MVCVNFNTDVICNFIVAAVHRYYKFRRRLFNDEKPSRTPAVAKVKYDI